MVDNVVSLAIAIKVGGTWDVSVAAPVLASKDTGDAALIPPVTGRRTEDSEVGLAIAVEVGGRRNISRGTEIMV
jgi:hypothetical protein